MHSTLVHLRRTAKAGSQELEQVLFSQIELQMPPLDLLKHFWHVSHKRLLSKKKNRRTFKIHTFAAMKLFEWFKPRKHYPVA